MIQKVIQSLGESLNQLPGITNVKPYRGSAGVRFQISKNEGKILARLTSLTSQTSDNYIGQVEIKINYNDYGSIREYHIEISHLDTDEDRKIKDNRLEKVIHELDKKLQYAN